MNNSDNKSFEFDSLFSDFAKYIKLPTNLFSEKSLRIFVNLLISITRIGTLVW